MNEHLTVLRRTLSKINIEDLKTLANIGIMREERDDRAPDGLQGETTCELSREHRLRERIAQARTEVGHHGIGETLGSTKSK